ncbi:UDP-N-acetylmuramoyl-L-alanyl-D-glutamate--2,6-diaminopimelate ligase [Rhodococcus sp. USK13]|uniref:UDP-N-acetylmuramoyl-L-alanyl-D-glutamate--2, 6-diaminopimelate ligase n=1 Tax=Rhodococcus sp. USK13 TaxID=2806442 RepID=UPI001BCFDEBB|nr:UDP-N-acetylmuramoyl-L-alanyl-D-glutamate--2,6-diaminopimelate ligase [Rhodococcus sp. USK13]
MSIDCRSRPPTPLREVLRRLGGAAVLFGTGEEVVTGISQDSRLVRPGDLYAALPGQRWHGAAFAAEAVSRGAVAMLSDHPSELLPTIVVDDPRCAVGPLASVLYGNPSGALDVYGVTGTNGKTSTAYLLEAGLNGAGITAGRITGITVRGRRGSRDAVRTTPEASELHQTLAAFRDQGVSAVAMEVSSHGLALHRVDGTSFGVAVFTNLARDHLDFHKDMASYFAAKARLFSAERCATAAIGIDDEFGRRLAATVSVPRLTFSLRSAKADIYGDDVHADEGGTSFRLHGPWRTTTIRLRLLGAHQVDNALAAVTALTVRGVDLDGAIAGIEGLDTVPGRLEAIDAGQPFLAFVDYMHNTGGQRRLFPYLRSLTRGKVIVVIGATGNRDPGKRARLGTTAAELADIVVVTDESPFSEDAEVLRDDVARAARRVKTAEVLVVPERGEAIATAVTRAAPGDVVVVAGRGSDAVQDFGRVRRPFDDRVALYDAVLRSARA